MPKTYPGIAVQIPKVWLPVPQVDLAKWSVIACDQFTSQQEYWQAVASKVVAAPSTYHLILPEVYLEKAGVAERIKRIHDTMLEYLSQGLLQPREGMVYVERSMGSGLRRGVILALDLEQYDFNPGAHSLVRSTEGTILDRLPSRIKIRQGGILELPHILVLIDDSERTVVEPLAQSCQRLEPLYSFNLMLDSGHLAGWLVDDQGLENGVIQALQALAQPQTYAQRYGLDKQDGVLLYAVGDGNHSMASAKAMWEELKKQPGVRMDHPARYALVEVQNLHDESLCFEPIHRVVFGVPNSSEDILRSYFNGNVTFTACPKIENLVERIALLNAEIACGHAVGMVTAQGMEVARIANPAFQLPVGTIQALVDELLETGQAERVDYVHGAVVAAELGAQPGNVGFILPSLAKEDLFRTVILDGALPRKTFSIGEARGKRFYMESRMIVP